MHSQPALLDLKTPPFSPRAPDPDKSTTHLLDSLVSFYRQEMMWVYRTRASLELVELAGPSTGSKADSPSTTEPSPAIATDVDATPVKLEPFTMPPTPSTRWVRRKQNFKLRLDTLPQLERSRPPSQEDRVSTSGVRVLELFESMIAARMESCERVNRLVRKANRANLYVR